MKTICVIAAVLCTALLFPVAAQACGGVQLQSFSSFSTCAPTVQFVPSVAVQQLDFVAVAPQIVLQQQPVILQEQPVIVKQRNVVLKEQDVFVKQNQRIRLLDRGRVRQRSRSVNVQVVR
jgi:hypothetical protein